MPLGSWFQIVPEYLTLGSLLTIQTKRGIGMLSIRRLKIYSVLEPPGRDFDAEPFSMVNSIARTHICLNLPPAHKRVKLNKQ